MFNYIIENKDLVNKKGISKMLSKGLIWKTSDQGNSKGMISFYIVTKGEHIFYIASWGHIP